MIFDKHINRYYLKYIYWLILGILSLVVVNYAQLLVPDIIGNVVDGIKEQTITKSILNSYIIRLLWISLAMFIGRFLWRICVFGFAVRIETRLRHDMFVKCEKMSQSYYGSHKTGALMALYTNDLNTVKDSCGMGVVMLIDVFFLGGLTIYKMVNLNLKLTLICGLPLLIIPILGSIIEKYMSAKYEKTEQAYAGISDFAQESFSGFSVIKAYVKEGLELLEFKKKNKHNVKCNVDFVKLSALLEVFIGLFISSIFIIIIGYGGYLVMNSGEQNPFTAGDLTRFIAYLDTLIWPMFAIAGLINLISRAKASMRRIGELLDQNVEINNDESIETIEGPRGEILIQGLNFQYPDGQDLVLDNINLHIKPGTMVGIIGKTGCGKTTLIETLLRLYNIDHNKIFIDGHDIMNLNYQSVREIIGYVPQDNFLFSDSIKKNISFCSNTIDDEKVQNSAIFSDVNDNIIEFDRKYDTILGERGVTVSGGQKQRISIARAFYKNPTIMILDDSVSAVDTKTEKTILSNLREYRKNKTTILIAHRISTMKSLDQIIVMDEGKIMGIGTHEELYQTLPLYKEMVDLQALEEMQEGSDSHE